MTTKVYLGQIRKYDRMINNKLADIYRLKTMAMSMTIEPQADKVQTSGAQDKLGDAVAKIVDLEKEIDRLVDIYVDKRNVIIGQIDALENDEYRDVLTQRFVLCKPFDEIYEEIGMSRRKMFYVYEEAMRFFEKEYGKDYTKK